MYKILITTKHTSYTKNTFITTEVVEFETQAEADIAIQRVNIDRKIVDSQNAIPLY